MSTQSRYSRKMMRGMYGTAVYIAIHYKQPVPSKRAYYEAAKRLRPKLGRHILPHFEDVIEEIERYEQSV